MVRGWAANTGANPYWPLRRKRDSRLRGNRGFEHPHAGDRVIVPWRSGVRSRPRTIRSDRIGAVGGGGPLGCAGREDEGAAIAGGGDGEDRQPRADQVQHPTPGPTGGMDGTPTPLQGFRLGRVEKATTVRERKKIKIPTPVDGGRNVSSKTGNTDAGVRPPGPRGNGGTGGIACGPCPAPAIVAHRRGRDHGGWARRGAHDDCVTVVTRDDDRLGRRGHPTDR